MFKQHNPSVFQWIQEVHDKLGFSSFATIKNYFNSGVILCKDCEVNHAFFDKWHELWLFCLESGVTIDQASFNKANHDLGNMITELSAEWNCQLLACGSIRYFHDSKIIHYFATWKKNAYLLSNPDVYADIKETGFVDDELKRMLASPKSLFSPGVQLAERNIVEELYLTKEELGKIRWELSKAKRSSVNRIPLKKLLKIVIRKILRKILQRIQCITRIR